MNKLGLKFSQWLLEGEGNDEKIIISFGLQQIKIIVINIVAFLFFSILLNAFALGICFLIIFIPLRRLAGGYHADTKIRCFFISNIIYVCNLVFVKKIYINSFISILECLFIGIAIWMLTPVDNKNRILSFADKHRIKSKCGRYILLYESIFMVLSWLRIESLKSLFLGVLATILVLQVIGIIKK